MTNDYLGRESEHMSTPSALKVARRRAAKIDALETAYTDDPGERDDQAKYDLVVEFVNELGKEPGEAYAAAGLSKNKYLNL